MTRSILSLRALATVAVGASMLVFGSGCGLLNAVKAGANPKVAWALNEPAPMSVVVRRADAAEKTATEVNRLLAETPADGDASWTEKTAPSADDAKKVQDDLAQNNPLYAASKARVVAAEVWVKELSAIRPAQAAAAAPAPAPDPAQVQANAAVASAATPAPGADEPQTDAAPTKKRGKGKRHHGSHALSPKAAKVQPDATATADANAPSGVDAAAAPGDPSGAPAATAPATPTTGTAAAAAAVTAPTAPASSLLGAVDPALAERYTAIVDRRQEIGTMKALAAAEGAALEQKGLSAEERQAHEQTKAKADQQADAAEAKIAPLQKELVAAVKASAKKASPDVRKKLGPAFVNLRQAVDDADIANGAAAVRYPLAATTMVDSVKAMVPVIVADIVEEQTGKRPNMSTLQPGVSMDGMKPKITLNGLDASDLGKISVADLTEQTALRTEKWVEHALGLLGTIGATEETLGFEHDVLDAMIDGFAEGGWTAPAPATIPAQAASNGR